MHKIIRYLVRLSENNNREWFLQHHGEFSEIQSIFACEVKRIMDIIGEVDPRVKDMPVKKCLLRITRDMRFASKNDVPFKTGLTAIIAPYGRFNRFPAYCIQMEQGKSYVAGGLLQYAPTSRLAVRKHIVNHLERYQQIVHDEEFARLFPVIGGEPLKKLPARFKRDEPYTPYLYAGEFVVKYKIPDREFSKPKWQDHLGHVMQVMKPFLDFIDEAIAEEKE